MSVLLERRGRVALLRLERPEALNALNGAVLEELLALMQPLDVDPEVGCFVLTGSQKAFAAGADIKELVNKSYSDMVYENGLAGWDAFARLRTPKIAGVSGYALGGGCELAMMCDIIFAADNAVFGQPEIKLGLIPGMGGSQRLTRLIGKAKAMEMILTGRMMNAQEAERAGLVARVLPPADLLDETLEAAQTIASYSKMVAMAARDVVNQALETHLQAGLQFERRTYHERWASADAKEGMQAFLEKRKPEFTGA